MSLVVVLDPRFKVKFINFCFSMIYDKDEAGNHIKSVLAALRDYYQFSLVGHNMTIIKQANENFIAGASLNVSSRDVGPKVETGTSRFLDHVRSTEVIRPLKTDLDIYLEEDVFILENDGNGIDIDPEFEALAGRKLII
jgi:hypothetical protein